MKTILLSTCFLVLVALMFESRAAGQEHFYDQQWREQYHFSPQANFMNDPNGTVFYEGEYHLFYQYNPQGNIWGHMSWGHAVSSDMIHWRNLPVALTESPGTYMVYSGSAVVDFGNTSGLCRGPDSPSSSCLIAIYTAAHKNRQVQHIAFSNDRGRTWTNYAANPVLDVGAADFRDPNVFWYAPQQKWVMTVALSAERKVLILDSPDLKHWTRRSTFGPAGDTVGQWECPNLVELPIEGSHETKWVLFVSCSAGGPTGGTGVRYLIGSFDGVEFRSEIPDRPALWADWGKDFYATNVWNDMPATDGRRVWIGWLSNWQYAGAEPTTVWRGAQSLPRTLTLRHSAEGVRLVQSPVMELNSLRRERFRMLNATLAEAEQKLQQADAKGDAYELRAELEPEPGSEIGFRLRKGENSETLVGFDSVNSEFLIDRTRSGDSSFCDGFPGRHSVKVKEYKSVKFDIFIDRSSVEVFANDGEYVLSDRIYPPPGSDAIELYAKGASGRIVSLTYWELGSAWK
jgi:fructan beta-fructosidase